VADLMANGDSAIMQFVAKPMGEHCAVPARAQTAISLPVSPSGPKPARVQLGADNRAIFIDAHPKANSERGVRPAGVEAFEATELSSLPRFRSENVSTV
jgi:hypothetical protein